MTHITATRHTFRRAGRPAQLIVALLIGVVVGAVATFATVNRGDSTVTAGAAANLATTDASRQYADWYTRSSTAGPTTTTAGQQYAAWYTRSSLGARESSAGARDASASRQYTDWYTRSSADAGRTTAGEQYRDWFTRNAGTRDE